jgi:hypothetical protein
MFMYLLLSGIRVTPIMFLLLTVNQASRAWNVKAQKGQRRRRSKEDRCQLSRIYSQLRIQLVTLKPPQLLQCGWFIYPFPLSITITQWLEKDPVQP